MRVFLLSMLISTQISAQSLKVPQIIMPKKISIGICATKYDTIKVPAIILFSYIFQGSFNWTSDKIFVDQFYIRKKLIINVQGFFHVDNTDFIEGIDCLKDYRVYADFYTNARAIVKLSPDYFINDTLIVSIRFKNKKNSFRIIKDELKYDLIPIKNINLNIDSTSTSVIVYPYDVYVIYLAGMVERNKSYFTYLKQFAAKNKFTIASKKYKQIPAGSDLSINVILSNDQYLQLKTNRSNYLPGFPKISINVKHPNQRCIR